MSRHVRTHESRVAAGSLRLAESTRRAQRLSSTDVTLTYTHSYPHVWIADSALFDRIIGPRSAHIRRRAPHYPSRGMAHLSTRQKSAARAFKRPHASSS